MHPGDREEMTGSRPDTRLLAGPYHPPALFRGDRAFCLFRDTYVVITSWTDARIPWARCRALDQHGGQGSGLLVDEELARAVRTESARAVKHWWGASQSAVKNWRRALGVDRKNNPGTVRLMTAASEKGAKKTRGRRLPPKAVEQRRERAIRLNLAKNFVPNPCGGGRPWTAKELALLGTADDEVIAARIDRTPEAVRAKRRRLGIPRRRDRRRKDR